MPSSASRFLTRAYYRVKPLLPSSLRWAIRRKRARRILGNSADVWPIQPSAGRRPHGWQGWPEGKRFAFVLTHDVESQAGLDRVRPLAELELELGFRSSFNFIPEGEYEVPESLLEWLVEKGFEVGVHDLHHDGRLYDSRKGFEEKAGRINQHLKNWGAVGFRSAFMLRRLDWLHDLDVLYDASTFDTDPFEPQPAGAQTIFPFWVGATAEDDSGYLELPYTLPQDSTLFLLLGEKNNRIWNEKLEWIAGHGGMALLDVHPDYTDFDGSGEGRSSYPAGRYREFLEHVRDEYGGQYWAALPREVAGYCSEFRPVLASRTSKRVCMLAYSNYQSDGRIVRYAQTLVDAGDTVDVIACAPEGGELGESELDGVTVYNVQHRSQAQKKGAVAHLLPLILFFLKAAWVVTRNHFRRRYDLIHVHNIPEWLVFAALVPRLSGTRILLDLHDLVPELYEAKFKRGSRSRLVTPLLKAIEAISCRFSHHVIISNHLWKDTVVKRSVVPERCSVFCNNIDPKLFYRREKTRKDDRKIILFPGTLQWHQGVDIAIRAFVDVLKEVPEAEFHIYGGGGIRDELIQLVGELGLNEKVLFHGPVPISDVPQLIANADLGVVPKRADSFGNEAYSTKIMEFMSQGVPAVISRTAIDSYYFDDKQVRFCESENVGQFARAMIEVLTDDEMREGMIRNALAYVAANDWGGRKDEYLGIVDGLIGDIDASAARVRDKDAGVAPFADVATS